MDCRVHVSAGDSWLLMLRGSGKGQMSGGGGGGFSQDGEHDLAAMVRDFLENNGSADSWSRCSSDSDSGSFDLAHLARKVACLKAKMDQYDSNLLSVVNSLLLSINEIDLHCVKLSSPCNASCIRFSLVKLLRLWGYDAGVCTSRWNASGKVPGGSHEYIDVIHHSDPGVPGRLIIDTDFRSHFEIARAVESYDKILDSLPVVFVGSLAKLNQFLQVMVEAARSSLKQNSMPVPPWRCLAYLQSKWQSPFERKFSTDERNLNQKILNSHNQCGIHLRTMQYSIRCEFEVEQVLKPINNKDQKLKRERHGPLC